MESYGDLCGNSSSFFSLLTSLIYKAGDFCFDDHKHSMKQVFYSYLGPLGHLGWIRSFFLNDLLKEILKK